MVLDHSVTDRYLYVTKEDGTITYAPQTPRGSAGPEIVKHTDLAENGPARVSGEILYDPETKSWVMDDNSGRYSARSVSGGPLGPHYACRTAANVEAAAELARRSGSEQTIVARSQAQQ
jgi:hypothetical protein